MADELPTNGPEEEAGASRPVSLKDLARHLGLSPTTVSLVLNNSPAAKSIPQPTRDRVIAAAKTLQYRPNHLARSLRAQKSRLLGVLVPEVSEGYSAMVLAGIEDALLKAGYAYLVTSHRHKPDLLRQYVGLLQDRRVEGLIAVDTPLEGTLAVPAVRVSGHHDVPGITNIVLDHDRAAELAVKHLTDLGHRSIAFIRGQHFSSDSETRWGAIRRAAARLGLKISPKLVAQLDENDPSPRPGFLATRCLLSRGQDFTALFAFNDISAIGAIRALRNAGRAVPADVSVVGFDDINGAEFHNPALTTIRQPLADMGKLAAETVLHLLSGPAEEVPRELVVQPDLIVRESTAPPAVQP